MPENNNIMSLEGQLVGMPLAGPESFSQQQLDYLKRALGVDETVLWEGDTQPIKTTSITINLSETVMNFELIRFEGFNSYAGITNALKFANTTPANSEMCFGNNLTISNGTVIVEAAYATVSGSSLTLIGAGRGQSNANGQMSFRTDRGPTLYKVVGIHRIAGGN